MTMFHRDAPTGDIHQIHQWTYADAAARAAASGFSSSDVGKVALQEDTAAHYILTDDSPITWKLIGDAVAADLTAHLGDTTDAHDASAISVSPSGNLAADDVQEALLELQGDADTNATAISNHLADTSDAHDASAISFSATGSISSTDVQAAIAEVASEAATALSSHESDTTSIHGITDTSALATKTGTEQLTNKDIDGGTASNSNRITLPKASSATLSGLTRKQGTIAYNTDLNKAVVDTGSALVAIGSGSGFGSLNLLTLDSAYAVNNGDDADAETTVGRWTSYADAAATTPVDMTGGSPGSTAPARSTSSPLNGSASIVFDLGSGSSRQGEGMVSGTVYVPPGYRGLQHAFRAVFEATGTLTDGDIVAYAYDITNSAKLAPTFVPGKILGAKGESIALFDIPSTCAELRVGFHVARTATTALSLKFDDLRLERQDVVSGMAGSNWQSDWTPTGSWSSNTTYTGFKRQVGDSWQYRVQVATSGAPTSANLTVNLPSGHVIDTAKLPAGVVSDGGIIGTAHILDSGTSNIQGVVLYSSTTAVAVRYLDDNTDGVRMAAVTQAAPMTFASGDRVWLEFSVPIAGADANVTMASSSTFDLGAILANGTRVTATPTKLGEWRSQLRNSSANTFTDTNGSPTNLPTAADGIWLPRPTAWGTVNSNNQPTKYVMYAGPNKYFSVNFFSSTGKTSPVDATVRQKATQVDGFSVIPATGRTGADGLITIVAPANSSSTNTPDTAIDTTGASITSALYASIIVSENALSVGVAAPRSEVWVTGNGGHGGSSSGETKIRNFSTIQKNVGTAITYVPRTTTTGDKFVINEDGLYAGAYVDIHSSSFQIGVTIDTSEQTTDVGSTTLSKLLGLSSGAANLPAQVTIPPMFMSAGQVVRAHDQGVTTSSSAQFRITKVSN